jgi:hypothetical protein
VVCCTLLILPDGEFVSMSQKIIILVETSSIAIGDPFFDDSVPRCERILRQNRILPPTEPWRQAGPKQARVEPHAERLQAPRGSRAIVVVIHTSYWLPDL